MCWSLKNRSGRRGEEEELHKRVRTDIGEEATETTKEKEKLDGSVERTVVCFVALLRTF